MKIDFKNKKNLYLLIGGGILLIGGIITAIVLSSRNKDVLGIKKGNYDKKTLAELKAQYPQKDAEYPLKKGSKGINVLYVNIALGLEPTNEFTDETEAVIVNKFNKKEISKNDYDFFYNEIKKYIKNV